MKVFKNMIGMEWSGNGKNLGLEERWAALLACMKDVYLPRVGHP
jgi:hypothetical protein